MNRILRNRAAVGRSEIHGIVDMWAAGAWPIASTHVAESMQGGYDPVHREPLSTRSDGGPISALGASLPIHQGRRPQRGVGGPLRGLPSTPADTSGWATRTNLYGAAVDRCFSEVSAKSGFESDTHARRPARVLDRVRRRNYAGYRRSSLRAVQRRSAGASAPIIWHFSPIRPRRPVEDSGRRGFLFDPGATP